MAPAREGRRAAVGVVNERRREAELRGCNAKGKGGTASPCSHASPSLSRRRSVAATAGSQVLVVVCRWEGMNEEREGFEGRGGPRLVRAYYYVLSYLFRLALFGSIFAVLELLLKHRSFNKFRHVVTSCAAVEIERGAYVDPVFSMESVFSVYAKDFPLSRIRLCGRLGTNQLLGRTQPCVASARGVPFPPGSGMRWTWLSVRKRDVDYANRLVTVVVDAQMPNTRKITSLLSSYFRLPQPVRRQALLVRLFWSVLEEP
ncbi:hypothetical protein PIB30_013111 [Stylosanthes scabra]|uniref:Uncharacterized protein n=1 Tax=Stylosanthes scabra TaxID=79078 RepID=A0ABU6V4N7_9FABA|nr:hypothetical protein [Stylosanthes scabra]